MALAYTSRATTNNATDTDDPSVTTGSFTPSNDSLLVAVCLSQANAGTLDFSISGGSLTWTQRANAAASSFNMGGRIYTAPVSTGASMTVAVSTTAGFGAITVAVVEFTGYDSASPIGATLGATTGSRGGAYSPALSGTSAADSYVVAGGVSDSGNTVKGASWTDIYDAVAASGGTSHGSTTEYIAGAVSAADWSDFPSSFATAAVAVEIKVASAASGQPSSKRHGGVPFMSMPGRRNVWAPVTSPHMKAA